MKKLLENSYICHGIGLILISLVICTISIISRQTVINSLIVVLAAYLSTSLTLPKITNHLLVERKYYIFPILLIVYASVITIMFMLRIEYARSVLIIGFFLSTFWLYTTTFIRKQAKQLKLAAIANFDTQELNSNNKIKITALQEPYLLQNTKQGLVVNLHGSLTPAQEKFIADCSINNIQVFHHASIKEKLSGKVQTKYLSENAIGTLQPNPLYSSLKRLWETFFIIAILPIALPIMLLTAILIKLESPGSAIFTQERIGQGGKPFAIYKFRSMEISHSKTETKFATAEQARVTRIGKIIRKMRIDELPQFFNVIKGDMALIGPRPEQGDFVKTFEAQIPFYGYRHMVKPGITGWAQTVQGYTDCTKSTREKLAHDLYYIKYFSFWLDINIIFKTLKTILTGFGAK
ncbi:exopolysaccharide biosynthesis polyprenyl glycosylphosphotransferase [Psychromonas sp. PT13]|uniref:exopolysaccharide biosynthesis polyprenyl glycosylphosphotransferase n=1 Tax=Psychromonas sp. PT13 TaxID=3439547 RepID=UPI003EB80F38